MIIGFSNLLENMRRCVFYSIIVVEIYVEFIDVYIIFDFLDF